MFTASYVLLWSTHLPGTPLRRAPCFDARAVSYPNDAVLRDYLRWRQADCHINCQYNTCFWALVGGGSSGTEAQAALAGSTTATKNELLHSRFGLNYASLPPLLRRGSVVFRCNVEEVVKPAVDDAVVEVVRHRKRVVTQHDDIMGDAFWALHPHILAD